MEILEKTKMLLSFRKTKIILLIIFVLLTVLFFKKQDTKETNNFFEEPITLKKEIKEEIKETNNIYVDVKGEVKHPGVYQVDKNSRVIDALKKAVLLKTSNTKFINLSKIIEDEMVIFIYSNKEVSNFFANETQKNICNVIKNNACVQPNGINSLFEDSSLDSIVGNLNQEEKPVKDENPQEKEIKLININEASIDQLTTLPGIGESKAVSIIEYRKTKGLFIKIEDILNVSGIGQTTFDKFKDQITI